MQISAQRFGQKDVGLYGPSGAKVSTKIGTSLSSLGLKNSKLRHGFLSVQMVFGQNL
jgi:hypothetical protein